MPDKWIYWLSEVGSDHSDIVGKKCANLGELTKAGFRVPPGYCLGVQAYDRFMNETEATALLLEFLTTFHTMKFETAAKEMRAIVESTKMPPDMEGTVKDYYSELCTTAGVQELFVATRSAGPASHPGQYETYLNVCGGDDVVQNVIRVWSSTFNARSLIARARLGLSLHYDPIGVAVLTMVDARAAGVMFTVNPINGDESKVAIEASFGYGEAVVSGSVTPDRYLVDKVTLGIDERLVSDKGSEFVYDPVIKRMVYKETPPDKRKLECLEDREILELAKIARKVEAHFGGPQDIEYSVSGSLPFPESIFLVQTRPESVWGKKKKEPVLGKKTGFELLFEKAVTPTKVKI